MTAREPAGHWPPHNDSDYRQEAVIRLGEDLADRFARVRLLVFDADGVLTPGSLVYGPDGEALKEFHAHDGLGLVLARLGGLKLAVITGRDSAIVRRRCTELRFDAIMLGRFDKMEALAEVLDATGCEAEEALYMGDDVIDLPAMFHVGVPTAVPGAPSEVREHCAWVATAPGGGGAVREVIELVLKSAGLMGQALERLMIREHQPTRSELGSDVRPAGQGDPS
ncbi:HAD hydrolase-like protein [bacterium]|nr:HAD hydrolase-like protein [bacterium]